MTELECTDTYLGDGTDCTEDPCEDESEEDPTGACCDGDSCTIVTALECEGTYQGDDSDCTSCDTPGACCVEGVCLEGLTSAQCLENTGFYQGDGSTCDPDPCNPVNSLGSCCFVGSCQTLDQETCEGFDGTYLGDGTNCTSDPCPAQGACCVDGVCSVVGPDECAGEYLGDDTDCSTSPCELIGLSYNIVGQNLVTDDSDTWTVDVYAVLSNGSTLNAISGTPDAPLTISASSSFYQNTAGGNTSLAINSAIFAALPDVEFDSFVTIGLLDQTGNTLTPIGVDFSSFENGGSITSDNGTWFVVPGTAQGDSGAFVDADCQPSNGVLIARLTVRDLAATVQISAQFSGRNASDDSWSSSRSITIDSTDCDP